MQGGDINRALSKGLEYNNRLGSRGQDGAAPQAGEPPATETAAAEPAPPVAVDPKVIDTEVARLLDQDRVCADALRAFASVQERISTIYDAKTGTGKLPALEKAIQMAQLRLELPEVKEDPTKSYEIEQELREHRSELRELRAEQRDLKLEAREHRERYNARSNEYTQRVRSVLEGRAAETQRQAAFETASNSYMSELETSWPTALKEAATAAKIPDDLLPALESRAMDRADADLNNRHPVKNINEFMTKVATEYAQELETHHRVKSQEYGRLATQRADQGGPPGSGVAPTVPQTPPTDLNDVYARAQNRLAAGMRGVAT